MAMDKEPFDIDRAMHLVGQAVRPYPEAALFELAEAGFGAPFQQLVACIISIRTLDEVTLVAARRLLEAANIPEAMAALGPDAIDDLIRPCTFHEAKAPQIHAIARAILRDYGGSLPCNEEVLRSFQGVGPKCAHLVLAIACGEPFISVDVHVHRVTNRWGYVAASRPEATMQALEGRLPRAYWIDINRLLVPFGKHVCTGRLPRCSTCPLLSMCRQVGVTAHR